MTDHLLQGGSGFFEITDHTTASDWERLIANIEDVLIEWDLNKQSSKEKPYHELQPGEISRGIWHEKLETVKYRDISFEMRYLYIGENKKSSQGSQETATDSHNIDKQSDEAVECNNDSPSYQDAENDESSSNSDEENYISDEDSFELDKPKTAIPLEEEREHGEHEHPERLPDCLKDLMATSSDFAAKAHCLVRWYNLRRFIIITSKGDTIVYEDRVKLILSSLSIALANTDCHVPIFLQARNPKNNFYQGVSEHLNIRTTYDMIFFRKRLHQYSHLSELINLFREKTGCKLSDPINVTIRLNYCLDFFDLFLKPNEVFEGNEYNIDDQVESFKSNNEKKSHGKAPIRMQDMRTSATFEQVSEALKDCLPHPYKILKFFHLATLWPPMSDKVVNDSHVHSDLDAAEAPIWIVRGLTSDNCNMRIVHETQAFYKLLSDAVDYAYDKLEGDLVFASDCEDREALRRRCLKLCYELSTQPEVILSSKQTDSVRKLVALLFYRAGEITETERDSLNQIAGHLKKRPSLSEIYRSFSRSNRPSVKEFIIRTSVSRPFNPIATPALPQRMFCTICDEEFRLCGAFSELCN